MNLSALPSFGGTPSTGTSAVGSSSYSQRRQDLESLDTSLLSGDLAGAQSAYAQLSQDVQAAQGSGNSRSAFAQLGNPDTTLGKDFKALGDALSSGDLTGAQKAFAQVRKDLQAARASGGHGGGRAHGHRGNDGDGDDGAGSGSTASPSTIVNITIDLGTLGAPQSATGSQSSSARTPSSGTSATDVPAGTSSSTGTSGGASTTTTAPADTTSGAASTSAASTTPAASSSTPTASSGAAGTSGATAGAPSSATGQTPAFEIDLSILSYSGTTGAFSFTSLSATFTSGSLVNTQA